MKFIKWLNKYALILIAAAFVFSIVIEVFVRNEHEYLLNIYGLEFGGDDSLTIGPKDNIVFNSNSLPESAVLISRTKDNGFAYSIKSGVYLKVNDTTLNRHSLMQGDFLTYRGRNISLIEIQKITDPFISHQKYFFVCDLIDKKIDSKGAVISRFDSCKSLLFYDSKTKLFNVVLLDTSVKLKRNGEDICAKLSGEIRSSTLKLEVIDVAKNLFVSSDHPFFNNVNVNVPTIRTEWQASHILVKYEPVTQRYSALFSQPLSIVFNDSTISEITRASNSRTVLLAQENGNVDLRDFYFAKFSNLFSLPVATLIKSDSRKEPDKIIFSCRNASSHETQILTNPIRCGVDNIKIQSTQKKSAEVLAQFIYFSKIDFLLPFFFLIVIFLFSASSLWLFTNIRHKLYVNALADTSAYTDFDDIESEDHIPNRIFWLLRMPIFIVMFILMCCKLIIAIKLCFTYPFFPQFLFIGGLMAYTTPLFIAYFMMRNSWHFNRKSGVGRIVKHSTNVWLLVTVLVTFAIAWHLYGRYFYENYLFSYGLGRNPFLVFLDFLSKFKALYYHNAGGTVYVQKYFQIPLFIIIIPVCIFVYDILEDLFITLKHKLRKGADLNSQFRSVKNENVVARIVKDNDKLFLFLIFCALFSKIHSVANFAVVVALYFLFKLATNRQQKGSFGRNDLYAIVYFILTATIVLLLPLRAGDFGYFINYILLFPFIVFYLLVNLFSRHFDDERYSLFRKLGIPFLPILAIVFPVIIYSFFAKPGIQNLSRSERRVNSIVVKDKALATGGKQYLSDIQFLEISKISAFGSLASPSFRLANREKPFHDFISKGLYPVIINDLNPLVLLDYGGWFVLCVLGLTWILLLIGRRAIWFSNFEIDEKHYSKDMFNLIQLFRYVPSLIIVGNSVWMFLSLFNIVFFTGRVVNGFGVESFVDWMELICFASFMGLVMFNNKKSEADHESI